MKKEKLTLAPWAKHKTQKEVWERIEKARDNTVRLENLIRQEQEKRIS